MKELLQKAAKESDAEIKPFSAGVSSLWVSPKKLTRAVEALVGNPSGGEIAFTLEHLSCTHFEEGLLLSYFFRDRQMPARLVVVRALPEGKASGVMRIPSVLHLCPQAHGPEEEIAELFGLDFGSASAPRILPEGFLGYPMRKDFLPT